MGVLEVGSPAGRLSALSRIARDTTLAALAVVGSFALSGLLFGPRLPDPATPDVVPPSQEHLRFWMVGLTAVAALTAAGLAAPRRAWLHQLGVGLGLSSLVLLWTALEPAPPSRGHFRMPDLRPLLLAPALGATLVGIGLAALIRRLGRRSTDAHRAPGEVERRRARGRTRRNPDTPC